MESFSQKREPPPAPIALSLKNHIDNSPQTVTSAMAKIMINFLSLKIFPEDMTVNTPDENRMMAPRDKYTLEDKTVKKRLIRRIMNDIMVRGLF